jgi:hypothetical protein
MNDAILTIHGCARLAQRGLSQDDLMLAGLIGRDVEGGLLVLQSDAEWLAKQLEDCARRVRRLSGLRTVEADGRLISLYRARRKKQKHLLRRAAQRDLEGQP